MRTFTQNEPLTDAELDRLGDFLKSCKGGNAMNVEALDGRNPLSPVVVCQLPCRLPCFPEVGFLLGHKTPQQGLRR
jgi:hypothetical protein